MTVTAGRRWVVLATLGCALTGQAQITRIGALKPRPQLTVGDSLTVVASPGLVTFALVSHGVATGSATVVATTTWSGVSLLSSLNVYAFFSSATAALSGGTPVSHIPSSCVLVKDSSGIPTGYTAFTQSSPLGGTGASVQLFSQSSLLSLGGTHTDNLMLEINLTSLPQLPAATYSGALTIQAQAF